MALQKAIQLNNGIITNYHVIKEAHFNFLEEKTIIKLDNYVSKEIRNNHKLVEETNESIVSLSEQVQKAQMKGDYDLMNSLNEKINTLVTQYQDISNRNYVAGTSTVMLDYIPKDISLAGLYKEVKGTEEYSKAKKV